MNRARDDPQPKIGAGHAGAMFRQGIAELRGAFFNESNVAQPAQYGLYGTKTPGEVAEARRSDGREMEEEQGSILNDCLRRAGVRDAHGRDEREPTMERT